MASDPKPSQQLFGLADAHDMKPSCSCAGAVYHCDGRASLLSLGKLMEEITGSQMVGFSVAYRSDAISLPDKAVTPESLDLEAKQMEAQEAQRKRCTNRANPNFERMMQ